MAGKYKAILFDMDGTLVPMNMEEFTNGYFMFLCKKLKKYGYDDKELVKTIWAGTKSMVTNDGTMINRDRFWDTFVKLLGGSVEEIDKDCIDFYSNEFKQAKCFTQENPLAREAVETARKKSEIVALATNPLFPMVGNVTRMEWVGLNKDDFDLVTSYETDSYCKPNPKYFETICERLNVSPKDCLMIGNDEYEDMYAASSLGMDCYLVVDTVIPSKEHPWNGKRGTFAELVEFLKGLEDK